MEVIFECFFEETFARLERSGLQARQKRKDVIDHLNSIISGCCQGTQTKCSTVFVLIFFHCIIHLTLGIINYLVSSLKRHSLYMPCFCLSPSRWFRPKFETGRVWQIGCGSCHRVSPAEKDGK